MAKKKKSARSTAQRERVKTPSANLYGKRTSTGRFKEMDEVGRSQKSDRAKKAKKKVKSGFGDRGDR